LLAEKGCVLTLSDEVENVGDKNYVKATATFYYTDGNIVVSAYAREAMKQKGMSDPQITGSASSYARKYALNGLFAIDDTKDDDATIQHNKAPQVRRHTPTEIKNLAKVKNIPISKIEGAYGKEIEQFSQSELVAAHKTLMSK